MGLFIFDHCVQEDAGIKKETMKQFFVVNDMYDFDNIGFTKAVDNNTIKYLICADCEVGPLGWHCISSKKNFVALARVKHVWLWILEIKPMILFFLPKKQTMFQSIWTISDKYRLVWKQTGLKQCVE